MAHDIDIGRTSGPVGQPPPGQGKPRRILAIEPIAWLPDRGAVVICAGGGSIPTVRPSAGPGTLTGVEAVIDKDLASDLLAENVAADLFLMATDVDGVYLDWGTPRQRRPGQVTPAELAGYEFAAGSVGPKAEAAAAAGTNVITPVITPAGPGPEPGPAAGPVDLREVR